MERSTLMPVIAASLLIGAGGLAFGFYQAGQHAALRAAPQTTELEASSSLTPAGVTSSGAGPSTEPAPAHARIVAVEPIERSHPVPSQHCEWVTVTEPAPVKDPHKVTGSAAGAVIGGIIGHQFGGGRGQDVATAVGAVAGGVAGRHIQQQRQQNNTVTRQEQQCRTVERSETRIEGYRVSYELEGRRDTLVVAQRPGSDTLPVRNGRVIAP